MDLLNLFAAIRAEPATFSAERSGGLAESALLEFEERLELKLPPQLRGFLLAVGPGDFSFGRILSPATEGDSSEIEDALAEYREGLHERMFQIQRLMPREPSIDLLPFARKLSRVFFFDLKGRRPPNVVWSLDTSVEPADEACPTDDTFASWLEQHFVGHS